ncbi:cyclic nucleotide-binding domain-containing protein [Bartonella sp. LJL80]
MRAEDQALIRQLDLFSQASEETFLSLVGPGFFQRFPPGVTLVEENAMQDFLYVLVEGQVEMYATSYGRETTLDVIQPVGLFILAAILNDDVCLQSARTLTEAQVLMIPASRVRQAMDEDTAFMHAVVRELARRYRMTIKELKNQKLRNGSERLANWILAQADYEQCENYIDIPFEKRLLAYRLGMTPENLSRAFATVSQHGINVDGSRIIFTDRQKLINFAHPDKLIDKREPV